MRLFVCALFAILVALAAAGTVVINGVCRDCTPPDAETVIVGNKVTKGRPGHGTVYIKGEDSKPAAPLPIPAASADSRRPPRRTVIINGGEGGAASDPYVVPEGYSGRVPGGTYVHNADCRGCDIRG
ncbi:bomanin Bicipital 1 [Drosophila grimshawi]|uniref:GH20222 n=1 Tax=Drosophila grimshawi TaxID=7222 RepID=B4J5S1_DROGR|nr:bomanin Bicipital 1 [Drosophila grimshawi]EDW01847.1 GH20222 [Drosophila grimshawi]